MTELEQIMIAALKDAGGRIDVATEFVATNMPDLIHQAMWWYGVSSFFLIALGFAGCYRCLVYFKELAQKDDFFDEAPPIVLFHSFLALASTLLISTQYAWLKILIAPKLWLIEFTASLVK